jgi:hypothetical protein
MLTTIHGFELPNGALKGVIQCNDDQEARVTTAMMRTQALTNSQAPVWRELYSEKMVVAEERRLRVDDSPMGKYQVNDNGAQVPY